MKKRMAGVLIALAAAGLVVALAVTWGPGQSPATPAQTEAQNAGLADPSTASAPGGSDRPAARAGKAVVTDVPSPAAASKPASAFAAAAWGAGPDQLGRDRPQEGNPEAPMSLAFDRSGNAVVLDQVNGRLVRYDKDGKPLGTIPLTVQGAQDLAFAADGTAVVLDRLVDKTVALMDPSGKLRGELPLEGKGIEEGGAVTGVFVDGEDVYVEREYGDLVRLGDTSGKVDTERPAIPGRPSRDGLSYLTAGLTDAPAGRLYVSSIVRQTLEHRFTRELRMGLPLIGLVLLDTDRAGIIYLGMIAELPTGTPDPANKPAILVICLDPLDGRPLGKVELPANTDPDETFRELTVYDEGGVLYAQRTEAGVTMQRYECR